jgi:hypothetical protein
MITEKDIKVRICKHGPEESMVNKTEVSATLHLVCSILVDDPIHEPYDKLLERAKDRVKKEILCKIYGDSKKRLMQARIEAMRLISMSPYVNLDKYQEINKMFEAVFTPEVEQID